MTDLSTIKLYATQPHQCSYLDTEMATTVFVDPNEPITQSLYQQLSELGFRRSGGHVYRPQCEACGACIPARIPVELFQPTRRHNRCMKKNRDLVVSEIASIDTDEHFALYQKYIAHRHNDGDMYPATQDQFQSFLTKEPEITRFYDMRVGEQLVGVMVCDEVEDALSAVYTYFDPDQGKRSLGTYAILWQIECAIAKQLQYLYLGYWIKQSPKMNYKSQYRPLELLVNRRWTLIL